MKKLAVIFIITILLSTVTGYAQQIIPLNANRPARTIKKKQNTDDAFRHQVKIKKADLLKMKNFLSADPTQSKNFIQSTEYIDNHIAAYTLLEKNLDSTEKSSEDEKPKKADSITLQLIGLGGVTDLENIKSAAGNAAIGFTIDWGGSKGCKDCCKMRARNLIYVLYNTRTGNSSDSLSIHKTFLFPDISKRDITIGYQRQYIISKPCDSCNHSGYWSASPFIEFSTSHFNDTNDNKFRATSAVIGCKFTFQGQIDLGGIKNYGISINPYYNIIDVDSKYSAAYNSAMLEHSMPTTFRTIGLNVVGTISDFQIFANYKYVLNSGVETDKLNSVDLKGGVFTMGVYLSSSIFTVKIPR